MNKRHFSRTPLGIRFIKRILEVVCVRDGGERGSGKERERIWTRIFSQKLLVKVTSPRPTECTDAAGTSDWNNTI